MNEEGRGPSPGLERLDVERMAELLGPLASPVRLSLLRYLTEPHYLEEIASYLGLTRQAARKHLDKLVAIGALERRSGTRETGAVTEYVVDQQALFLIYDEFEKLASLRGERREDVLHRTIAEPGARHEARPEPGPSFHVVRGLNTGRRIPLSAAMRREWTIGRDPQCDLVIPYDPFVSNRHAEVRWQGDGFVVTDLRSTNGTRHNWAPLASGGEVVLRHGDVVAVGRTLLLFWDAGTRH